MFAELMIVDRPNHILFEKWRTEDLDNLDAERLQEYNADAKKSTAQYNKAFCETKQDITMSQVPIKLTNSWM